MKKKNLILVTICVAIVLSGVFLVLTNKSALDNTLIATGLKEATPILADADPYMKKLLQEIPVLQVMPKKKKNSREIWKVGRGVSYPNYLLRAQKHLDKFGGKVLSMEEIESRTGTVVDFDFVAPFGDTFYVELQVADSFYNNTSRLAVAFYASKELAGFSSELNGLNYPYSLLITPSELPVIKSGLKNLKNYESVIWLPMEDKKLRSKDFSKSMVFIHQSKTEIQDLVSDALKKFPNAQGIATRFGSRAVEQQALLHAMFKPLKDKDLWFMDLTNNRYSRTEDVCDEIHLNCRIESPFDPSRMTHANYVSKVLKSARRSGKAILILPLSDASFKAIENLEADAAAQGSEFVSLSNIFQNE
ncbi:MAG: divergent polysaccharide deacetylase family protein [Fibrobacter sp.]|nr:divergent polysaccharide deacetylase family protein [Fibrobacter sp.]